MIDQLARLLILFGCLVSIPRWTEAMATNLQRVQINQAWMSLRPVSESKGDSLQDGVPDGWDIQTWSGATAVFSREVNDPLSGRAAATLMRTNNAGVIALAQQLPLQEQRRLLVVVRARGDAAAIQLRFRIPNAREWLANGWLDTAASKDWQPYRLSVVVPAGATKVELRLRTSGKTWFDEAYLGLMRAELPDSNLLQNPGFEEDGWAVDPIYWWKNHTAGPDSARIAYEGSSFGLSYANIVDMLAGRYEVIQARARQLGAACVTKPHMVSWITGRDEEFEQASGLAAREKVYQLAIELAPSCPQPYAALAQLYEPYNAKRAAELYHQAALSAGETALAGRYFFEEGFLHVRRTGMLDAAVRSLRRAERISGWEEGSWYRGAASLYLGEALVAQGNFDKAAAAYQRVLDCSLCNYHRSTALRKLEALATR